SRRPPPPPPNGPQDSTTPPGRRRLVQQRWPPAPLTARTARTDSANYPTPIRTPLGATSRRLCPAVCHHIPIHADRAGHLGVSGAGLLLAARQLPPWSDVVAGVAVGVALQVVLVLGFGFPERSGRGDFGDHLAGPQARSVHVGDGVFGDLLLLVAGVEDGGA